MNARHKGIAAIIVSAMGFAIMAACVRLCDCYGAELSCFQKGFFRNFVALVIAATVFARHVSVHGAKALPRGAVTPLACRCLFGSIGIFANFYAISHIQIGEAMTLNKTAPIFTVIASWLLMGERIRCKQACMLAVGALGALLVVRPGFRIDNVGAALLGLSSGLGAGVAYAFLHVLGRKGVDSALIVLVFSAFSCLASVPFAAFGFTPMSAAQLVILFGAGIGAAIGQFGITLAYRFAEPREIAAYDYLGVVFSALLGLVFFGQVPGLVSVCGFLLIFSMTLFRR